MFLQCTLLSAVVATALAQVEHVAYANLTRQGVSEGEICNINALRVPAPAANEYFDCIRPDDATWEWTHIGLWTKVQCEPERTFLPQNQTCVKERDIRRFGGGCNCGPPPCTCQPPAPPVIPMPCPHATGGAVACPGCPCSWMLAPLAIDPNTPHGYLQCRPAFPGIYCGVWQPMPCAPATRFDLNVQVCVHDECARPPCGGGCGGGVAFGACNAGGGCPGGAHCMGGSCCGAGGWGKKK